MKAKSLLNLSLIRCMYIRGENTVTNVAHAVVLS